MISFLSLGANIGDRRATLSAAIRMIENRVGSVVRVSNVIETEPQGFTSENKFLNLCISIDTTLSPRELLLTTQQIERELGRKKKSVNYQYEDRPIDIDILLYGDETINEPDLVIPHPRMKERDFIMTPLKEITR